MFKETYGVGQVKILIVGGAGFGGSGLTNVLLEKGYDVSILDMVAPLHATLLSNVMDRINYIWKNAQDIKRSDVRGHDIVLHFAAQPDVPMGFPSPRWTVYNNVMGTLSVLEACKRVRGIEKFLLASSANAVQRPKYLPIDAEHPPNPANVYGASKGCQELLCWAYYRSYGIPIVIFRNGIIYGPNMRREIFIYKWIRNILLDKPCILEGGDQTRDPTYVTDTTDAWLLGIEAEREKIVGETFQISYGEEYKVSDILERCMKTVGKKVDVVKRPYRPGEKGMRECFNIEKAQRVLGYNPKVSLEEGLKLTVEWIRSKLPEKE